MVLMRHWLVVFSVAISLAGCINDSRPNVKATDLAQQGFVLGEISEIRSRGVRMAVTIDGEAYGLEGNVLEGTRAFIIALPPGDHVLQAYSQPGGHEWGTSAGIATVVSYPLNIPFTVRKGQVTDIGQVLIRRLSEDKKFVVARVDSGDRGRRILEHHMPDVYARVGAAGVHKTDGPWSAPKLVRKARGRIALEALHGMAGLGVYPRFHAVSEQWHYEGGPLGTLVRLKTHREGDRTKWKVLDAGTFADVSLCITIERRGICRVNDVGDKYLLTIEGTQVARVSVPAGFETLAMHVAPNGAVLLADRSGNVRLTRDAGSTWITPAIESHEPNFLDNRVQFFNGREGVYFHYAGKTEGWYHAPYDSMIFSKVRIDKGMETLSGVLDTPNGTFMGPAWTLVGDSAIFFRPKGADAWRRIVLPQGRCAALGSVFDDPHAVAVRCGGVPPKPYVSRDQGATWVLDEERRWPQ